MESGDGPGAVENHSFGLFRVFVSGKRICEEAVRGCSLDGSPKARLGERRAFYTYVVTSPFFLVRASQQRFPALALCLRSIFERIYIFCFP